MGENDTRGDPASRLTQRAPDAPASGDRADTGGSDDSGYGGGNLVGSNASGTEAAARSEPGTDHGAPSEAADDPPVGSALSRAQGRNPGPDGGDAAGAGQDLGSGSGTLGATTGGERASAGRADPDRSSRDDGNSLQEQPSGAPR